MNEVAFIVYCGVSLLEHLLGIYALFAEFLELLNNLWTVLGVCYTEPF